MEMIHQMFPNLWSDVLGIVAFLVSALAAWTLNYLRKRWSLDVSAAQEQLLRKAIRSAVYGAEEWAANQFKLGGVKPASLEKMQQAYRLVLRFYPKLEQDDFSSILLEEIGALKDVGSSHKPLEELNPKHTSPAK